MSCWRNCWPLTVTAAVTTATAALTLAADTKRGPIITTAAAIRTATTATGATCMAGACKAGRSPLTLRALRILLIPHLPAPATRHPRPPPTPGRTTSAPATVPPRPGSRGATPAHPVTGAQTVLPPGKAARAATAAAAADPGSATTPATDNAPGITTIMKAVSVPAPGIVARAKARVSKGPLPPKDMTTTAMTAVVISGRPKVPSPLLTAPPGRSGAAAGRKNKAESAPCGPHLPCLPGGLE